MKITFDTEDEADIGRAIHYLVLWVKALAASHAALPAELPLTRPETPSAKPGERRSARDVHAPTPPEDLRKAIIARGIVFASMLVAQHGVTHIGELSDDQLRAALRAPA